MNFDNITNMNDSDNLSLLQALMNRNDMTENEALQLLSEMQARVDDGENPEEVLYDEGLEPGYVFDLLDYS